MIWCSHVLFIIIYLQFYAVFWFNISTYCWMYTCLSVMRLVWLQIPGFLVLVYPVFCQCVNSCVNCKQLKLFYNTDYSIIWGDVWRQVPLPQNVCFWVYWRWSFKASFCWDSLLSVCACACKCACPYEHAFVIIC